MSLGLKLCSNARCPLYPTCGKNADKYTDVHLTSSKHIRIEFYHYSRDRVGRVNCPEYTQLSSNVRRVLR